MRTIRAFAALLLLAIWPVVTSHALLEHLEIIHVVHDDHGDGGGSHEHNESNHEVADGNYTMAKSSPRLGKPALEPLTPAIAAILTVSNLAGIEAVGPEPPDAFPPLLSVSWQFHARTAAPVRAPSFLP